MVEQDVHSLKKNRSATNFYETVKETISKSSLGACFSITLLMECWNKSLSIKDVCGYKTKYVKWNGTVYMNTYSHRKYINIAILEMPGEKQPLWYARWISATILKMILVKFIWERCC